MQATMQATDPQDQRIVQDFETFYRTHQGLFLLLSSKHRGMGILEEDDVKQEIFLCWVECLETYDPEFGASFHRFVTSKFENLLHERYRILRRGGISYNQEKNDNADYHFDTAMAHTTESTVDDDHAQWQPDNQLLEDEIDPPAAEMVVGISLHHLAHLPIYQHPQYRSIIQAAFSEGGYRPRDGAFARDLSDRLGVSPRRVLQALEEIQQHLLKPSLLRDRKMLEKHHELTVALLYHDVYALQTTEKADEERMRALVQSILHFQTFHVPVLVDQYFRVIDGVQRVHAARHLKIPKIPIIIHSLPNSENKPDDIHFLRARKMHAMNWKNKKKNAAPSRTNFGEAPAVFDSAY